MIESNLLSLSYGRIVKKDIAATDGLLPESFETYQVVEPGDIVFRFTDLQNDKRSLRSALVSERGIITSAYVAATPRGILPQYAAYLMRSYDTTKVFYGLGGGVRQSLRFDDVRRIPTLVPPASEQRAIADYLDRETAQIDALIGKQERLIETLRERRAAVVDHAVSPSPEWTATSIKYLLAGVDQGVSPQAEAGLAEGEGEWGVLKSGCVNRGVFRHEEHKRLAPEFPVDPALAVVAGDLIVSRASGSPDLVGSAAVVDRLGYRLILSDKLFRLRPKRDSDSRYLYWFMNSRHYRTQVRRAISGAEGLANNLPLSALRSFRISLPPLEEQRRIVGHLDEKTARIDALIAKAERLIELSKERRSALITAAVTGQIDVRTEVA